MALAEMCKARIAVHKSTAEALAKNIQELGCCEFVAGGDSHVDAALLFRPKRQHIDELASEAKYALRLLEPYETHGKRYSETADTTLSKLEAQLDEKKFTDFVSLIRDKERELTETKSEISRLGGLMTQICAIENISYPLELFTTGTELFCGSAMLVAHESAAEFERKLRELLGELCEIQHIASPEKEQNDIFAVICEKQDAEKLNSLISEFGASKIDIPKDFKLAAPEEKKAISEAAAALVEKEKAVTAEFGRLSDEWIDKAKTVADYCSLMHDRLEAADTGDQTENVLIWDLWLPKSETKKLEALCGRYADMTSVSFIEPDEGEEPPTLLKNAAWASSMEPLTLMYGTPTYGGVDPTPLMAPFFFLFLGMCFGDAGYGLILTGVLGYFLTKKRMAPTMRKFFVLMTVGMVVTVVFGAITGSWFGDSVTAFPFLSGLVPAAKKVQLLDPMNDPMTLLAISLGLGFIQVIFGLCIAFVDNWRSGNKLAAFGDQGGWIIFLFGLVLTGLSMSGRLAPCWVMPSKAAAAAGALILVATQGREKTNIAGKIFSGVMSLYNVTGYLGDVLSYSRLLALGLGSAAVGMVINLLAKLVAGSSAVGIPIAILIFVLGHSFSIAVNLLGAFIHSLRLQYVEFFGKFYNAAGHDFMPLCNRTQYLHIVEETSAN